MKHLVSALLPRDRREQILGDLHERGFRFLDIVNVVPRVWISRTVRVVTSPVPRFATASDTAIRDRTEQLARQGVRDFYGASVLIWILYLPFRQGLQPVIWQLIMMNVAVVLFAIPVYLAAVRRALPASGYFEPSRARLLTSYRQQIDYQITTSKSMLYAPSLIVLLWLFEWYKVGTVSTRLVLSFFVAITFAVLAERRISRLRRELECLEIAQ